MSDKPSALADAKAVNNDAYWVEVAELDDKQYRIAVFKSALRQDWPNGVIDASTVQNVDKALTGRFGRMDSMSYLHFPPGSMEPGESEQMATVYHFSVLKTDPATGAARDPQQLANETMALIAAQFPEKTSEMVR